METEQLGDEPALVELVQALEYQETNYLILLHLNLKYDIIAFNLRL